MSVTVGDLPSRPEPERRKPRWGRRIVLFVLSLALLMAAGIGGFALYLNQTVERNVKHDKNLLPDDTKASATDPQGKPLPATGIGENYLVIGSDTRPGDHGRSDVIIIAHVPEDKKKVYLVHVPRDLYVDIPGRGKDKINAAWAYGNSPLLVTTLQRMLHIRIDHVAKTDFEGLKGMVDAIGGVRVYAEEASTQKGNGGVDIVKGWNTLDGTQALGFVRERYQLSQGDISRGRRQLALIKAVMVKAVSRETLTNPLKIADFVDAGTTYLTVDDTLTTERMRGEAWSLKGLRSGDIVFVTAPFSGFGTSPAGASIDIVDWPKMRELGSALRTDTMAGYADVAVLP